jgi:hypothetical protein
LESLYCASDWPVFVSHTRFIVHLGSARWNSFNFNHFIDYKISLLIMSKINLVTTSRAIYIFLLIHIIDNSPISIIFKYCFCCLRLVLIDVDFQSSEKSLYLGHKVRISPITCLDEIYFKLWRILFQDSFISNLVWSPSINIDKGRLCIE